MGDGNYENAIKAIELVRRKKGVEIDESQSEEAGVVARYGKAFRDGSITDSEFRSFLSYENNAHWIGLSRQARNVCADMHATRAGLAALVDESLPLAERVDAANEVRGMGKGIITAILLVAYPKKFGVWNGLSEHALKSLGLFPAFPRSFGPSLGKRYVAINEVLQKLAKDLDVSLWTLDTIWWYMAKPDS